MFNIMRQICLQGIRKLHAKNFMILYNYEWY